MKDGHTRRQHLEAGAKTSALARAELAGPAFPPEGQYIWDWFVQLHDARAYEGERPQAISYAEIDAWRRLTRTPIQPREVALLREIDTAWMRGRDDVSRDS